MNRLFLTLCLAFAAGVFGYAQSRLPGPSTKIDTLLIQLSDLQGQGKSRVDLLNQLGFEYWTVSPLEAESYGKQALVLADELDYTMGVAFANRVIGVAYWVQGNYTAGLRYLLTGRDRYMELHDTLGMANCTMNLGLIYSDQQDFQVALENFTQALAAFESLGAEDRVATTLTKIGAVYTAQGQYDSAYTTLKRALEMHEQGQFYYGISEAGHQLAKLFYAQNEYNQAIQYAQGSLDLCAQIGDREGMVNNHLLLGQVGLIQENYGTAQKNLEQAQVMALEISALKQLRDSYRGLRDLYQQQGRYAQAYAYFEEYAHTKDSIFNEEVSRQLGNLQTERELARQQQELDMAKMEATLSQAEAQYSRTLQWVFGIGLLIVLLLSGLMMVAQRKQIRRKQLLLQKNEELNSTRQNLQEVELENSRLKTQELQRELDYKNRELTSYTLNFAQKNTLIEELKEQLAQLKPSNAQQQQQMKQLRNLVSNTRNADRDWEDFRLHFQQVHPHFFQTIKQTHPDLSNGEQKLCALVRLNLNMKETAAILGISPNSVKTARYRLRLKLGLETQDNLMDYLMQFDHLSESA